MTQVDKRPFGGEAGGACLAFFSVFFRSEAVKLALNSGKARLKLV